MKKIYTADYTARCIDTSHNSQDERSAPRSMRNELLQYTCTEWLNVIALGCEHIYYGYNYTVPQLLERFTHRELTGFQQGREAGLTEDYFSFREIAVIMV